MVFLSYPKYYRDAEEKLALVETDLVESTDPEWDYEVSKGIWQLKVKTDGTFQAQHEGDIFTYRFQNLGIGQGSQFRSVVLGEPDFSNFQIIGDTIRWTEVLPDIDLTVRYIHDILKVDVIVKREFMNDLRAEVNSGGLSGEDYLTARFDIPSVFINSQTKQGGEDRDIYAEPIEFTNTPLTFERDGKTLHKLRPVESYVLDEDGEPMYLNEINEPIQIRSSQRWQLERDGGGFAEMSANLGDLANAPEGDVVIDPSTEISSKNGYTVQDTLIRNGQTSPRGSNATEMWVFGDGSDDRLLFGFDLNTPDGFNSIITSAELEIYETALSAESSNAKAQAHKITTNWNESTAEWTTPWSNNGGDYVEDGYYSKPVTLPIIDDQWIKFDVTQALRSQLYEGGTTRPYQRGFMLRGDTSTLGIYFIAMNEYSNVDYRPRLTLYHQFTQYGADPGYGYDIINGSKHGDVSTRVNNMSTDKIHTMRVFVGDGPDAESSAEYFENFAIAAYSKNMKVIPVFPAEGFISSTASAYGNYVRDFLLELTTYISNGTIPAVEIGNEEADGSWFPSAPSFWTGSTSEGEDYAEYYLNALDKIKGNPSLKNLEIIASAGTETSHHYIWVDTYQVWNPGSGSSGEFLEGFIDEVIDLGGREKLPDTLAIHNYTGDYEGTFPPEFRDNFGDANTLRTEWFERLNEVVEICNDLDYIPNFAVTEYGYSPNPGFDHAPTNTSEAAHAIYYLRAVLMGASMRMNNNGNDIPWIGWKYHEYFHYSEDYNPDPDQNDDYGFFADDGGTGVGISRAIREIARNLYSVTDFGKIDSSIWVPLEKSIIAPDETAICGWVDLDGDLWGAIWRFDNDNQDGPDFIPISAESREFMVDDHFSNYDVVARYRFTITSGNADLDPITTGTVSKSTSGGYTTFTIPAVTHNPIIFKLEK